MSEPTRAEIEAFALDQAEGIGDNTWRTENVADNYWTRAIPPSAPQPAPASGDAYRASNAHRSTMYSGDWVAGANGKQGYQPNSIANNLSAQHANAKTLDDYRRAPARSQYLPKDGESPLSYVQRMKGIVAHLEAELSPELYAEVANAWNVCVEAVGNDSHEAVRNRLDKRSAGESVGLLGADPKAMASDYRARQQSDMAARFGNTPGYQSISGVQIDSMSRRAQDNTNVAVNRPTMIG